MYFTHRKILFIIFVLFGCCIFSHSLKSQNVRMGIDFFGAFSHPPKADSFTFIDNNGETQKIMENSKGKGMHYGLGLITKFGFKRHYFVIQPEIRFYDHEYVLNVEAVAALDAADSVKFGVSKTNLAIKTLYEYKFLIGKQKLSFNLGGQYVLEDIKIKEISTIKSGSNREDYAVKYTGLRYKMPDLYEEQSHLYGILGLNWDLSHSISAGIFYQQRLTEITENAPRFFYGFRMNYTMSLKNHKDNIYIHRLH